MDDSDLQVKRQAATLRLLVEDRLRAAIASGRFKPGQRLVERELCELTGVGRTSIREALRQLEAEGIVTTIPHRGPIVSTITVEEAEQLYAVRALLEGYAGRVFAEQGSEAALGALTQAVERFAAAASGEDQRELIAAKTAFYANLMEGCGNKFVQQMLTMLHNRITLLRVTSMARPGRIGRSMEEIREIRNAIADRDGARAEAACIRHIETAAEAALAVLAEAPQDTMRKPG